MRSIMRVNLAILAGFCLIVLALVAIHYTRTMDPVLRTCYTAAVLDHVKQSEPDNVAKTVDKNFRVFINATKLAKEHNVDLIVFPESSLYSYLNDRATTLEHAIELPNEIGGDPLCKDEQDMYESSVPVSERLSCLAKINRMYLVAQLLDKQPCDPVKDDKCLRPDKHYIYNTAVMFDRNGRFVAKYHKIHPYGELNLDPGDPVYEMIIVDTEIGRFGFQICFDLVFETPGHKLATEHGVDTMITPMHWFDELPFLAASQFQMAWSLGNNVNVLAANIHRPETGSVGSGVYNGPGKRFQNANFPQDHGERLVIQRLPINPRTTNSHCNQEADQIIPVPVDNGAEEEEEEQQAVYWNKQMKMSNITMIGLDQNQTKDLQLEHDGVWCNLSYKADFSMLDSSSAKYFLLAANRLRPDDSYGWWEQFCVIVYCSFDATDPNKCQKILTNNNFTTFQWAKIQAQFDNRTVVYPSALESQRRPIPMNNGVWSFGQTTVDDAEETTATLAGDTSYKRYMIEFGQGGEETETAAEEEEQEEKIPLRQLSILSLYGRLYELDPPYEQKVPDGFHAKKKI